jgi:DNA polymerase-3 subunit delta
VFYIFHGPDEFSRTEYLNLLRARVAGGDSSMAELNTSVLDGSKLTLGELCHHCDAIPFLYDRRLVLVHDLLARLSPRRRGKPPEGAHEDKGPTWKREYLEQLVDYLPTLPPTTRLFFIESRELPASHPILRLARAKAKKKEAVVKAFPAKKDAELPTWIQRRATQKGGAIEYEAAYAMAAFVGNDLRLLDSELEKLLLYTDGARPVIEEDVRLLVSRVREVSIFSLVDSIGQREAHHALRLLHRMLDDGVAGLYLLAMITRQFRLLLQVKELQQRSLEQPAIVDRLKLHPYVVSKVLQQARNFSLAQLDTAFDRLVEADWAIKTGRASEVLALDLLVVDLTQLGAQGGR